MSADKKCALSANNKFTSQSRTFNTKITLYFYGCKLETTALVDSGSDKCLLPLSVIPVSLHKNISPSQMTFSGCGQIQAIGKIEVYLQSSYSNWKFKNVEFYVVRESLPPILGKSFIMEHSQVQPSKFNIHGAGLELFLKNGKKIVFPWTNDKSQLFLSRRTIHDVYFISFLYQSAFRLFAKAETRREIVYEKVL